MFHFKFRKYTGTSKCEWKGEKDEYDTITEDDVILKDEQETKSLRWTVFNESENRYITQK